MNDDVRMQEQLSALADGQLQGDEFVQALAYAETSEGREAWHMYHLVGDVMRSSELARPVDTAFLQRLCAQLLQEVSPAAVLSSGSMQQATLLQEAGARAANSAIFRWKIAAGVASLAAVAAIGWVAYGAGLQGGGSAGAQLADASAPQPAAVATADAGGDSASVMIRDPRLDDLLAAHKQFGGISNLQMPAGFLRNATFEAPAR